MADKDLIDSLLVAVESKIDNSVQLNTTKINKVKESEVVNEETKELETVPETESISIEETITVEMPEKSKLIIEEASKQPVTSMSDTTPLTFSKKTSGQLLQTLDTLMESAVPSQESLIKPIQDQIVPVDQGNLMADSQQQTIPTNELISNNCLKQGDNEVDVNQQSLLSVKGPELKNLTMKDLSEFLSLEPSQNVELSLLETKSDLINEDKIKCISFENNLSEKNEIGKKEIKSENNLIDALSVFANTAALVEALPIGNEGVVKSPPDTPIKQDGPVWCDVGVMKGTSCVVKQFHSVSITDEHEKFSLGNLPDYTNKLKIDIQPGTAYKFRIAAVNICGRGEWSEVSTFKTCYPGYPGAPTDIKITKTLDGASLTWEAPTDDNILEYTVCLAVKKTKEVTDLSPMLNTGSFNFFRVYCGPDKAAIISHESLDAALIDKTKKPAIIFRIAAKNEKGYGPATQVRWLQNNNVPESNKKPTPKREKKPQTGVPKRPKL